MDGKKIAFIIILVLIALVFAGGTVWGASKSGGQGSGGGLKFDPTQIARQLGGLQDGLAKPPSLAPKDVRVDLARSTSSDCLKLQSDLVAPVSQTCMFAVAAAEGSFGISPEVRKLQLSLAQGDAAVLTWKGQVRQDNGNLIKVTVEKDLLTGGVFKLDIYKPGGSLTITCQKSSADSLCRLRIAK